MSIIIHGMDMPTERDTLVLVKTDGTAIVYDDEAYMTTAVPVPPHGRLIESVELYGRAEDIKTKAMSVRDKPQSWQFGVFWAIMQIKAALTNAPTIIEAEEK